MEILIIIALVAAILVVLLAMVILAILAAVALYALLVMGRRWNPRIKQLQGWSYAHRGLHGDGVPENSMTAFRLALEKGYGIELDVHLLADGELAVFHDSQLIRTTGAEGTVEALTAEQLKNYRLEGTQECIPTFRQVLELFDGKAPMIIELKTSAGNYAALTDTLMAQLEGYGGAYGVESFDPRCALHLRRHYKNVVRGQLSDNFMKGKAKQVAKVGWPVRLLVTKQLCNFLILPDFVAYRFEQRKTLGNFLVRKLWGAQGVAWTIRTPEKYEAAVKEGWLPIFEGFCP